MLQVFGKINPPQTYSGYTELGPDGFAQTGPFAFVANLVQVIVIIAGIFTLINFITSGYMYLTSEGNPEKIVNAGNKMMQSLIGLIVVAAAYIIAAAVGYIFFKDPGFLINPKLFKLI